MPRKRSRGTRYLDEQETRIRVALDNTARSTSTEPHNRRKPGLLSTGTPELAEGAVTNAKISDVNAGKVDAGTLADARIPQLGWGKLQGQAPKGSLPGDIHYGRVNANNDIEWGNKSVPKTAITGVNWEDVDSKPNIPTKRQVERWAEAAAKKAVKK